MDPKQNISTMLELISRPAFTVIGGKVHSLNQAASNLLLEAGTPVTDLLISGKEEYHQLSDGCLYLTLSVSTFPIGASVTRIEETDLFVLDAQNTQPQLQALALAAKTLRSPLSGAMLAADRLSSAAKEDPTLKSDMAILNQQLHQLLRVIGNMSDAQRYTQPSPRALELQDATALFREIFEKAGMLAAHAGVKLTYQGPEESILCPLDAEKIERAIYNLVSNAIKSSPGSELEVRLARKVNRLILTVRDHGQGIQRDLLPTVHSRYLRQPGLEDFSFGIGLGMVMICAAATAHQGTVLIDQPADGGTRVTLTLKILPFKEAGFHSHVLRIDYTGERDHGLVELSEHLPHQLYV